MVAADQPKQRGRPKRHEVDVLFTRLWFDVVKARSGLRSAYAIELALEPHLVRRGPDGLIRPGKWDNYEDGSRVPTGKVGLPSPVDLAEARFRGTARFFDSPLRTLLRENAVTMEWVLDQLLALPLRLRRLLFESPARGQAPKLRSFDRGVAQQLAYAGGFDALVASVLLMRRAELIPSVDLRKLAWMAYMATQHSVKAKPAFARVADDLFNAINVRFPNWLYVNHDRRTNLVVHPVSTDIRSSGVDLYRLESWERLIGALLQREKEFLDRHVDTGKYMRVTELFSYTREELLQTACEGLRKAKDPADPEPTATPPGTTTSRTKLGKPGH